MSKKPQQNKPKTPASAPAPAPKAPEAPALPTVEDFFTQFLDKRKKYFVTKMDEINELEKKDAETLKPDQKDKIGKKSDTADRIKYFDDIKGLYADAYSKKGPAAADASKGADALDGVVADFVNLFVVGQAIHNFERNSKQIEHSFNSDQMTSLQEAYLSLKHVASAAQLDDAKNKLKAYAKNEELKKAVGQFLTTFSFDHEKDASKHGHGHHHDQGHAHHHEQGHAHHKDGHKHEHHEGHAEGHGHGHAHRKQSGKVEQEKPKKALFAEESDDEEEPHHGHHHHHKEHSNDNSEGQQKNEEADEEDASIPLDLLKPLPEGDDNKADEFKAPHQRKHHNKPYNRGPRNHDRPPRPHQGGQGQEGAQPQAEGKVQEGQGEGQAQGEGQRPKRPYNPHHRDGERGPYKPRREGDGEGEGERRQYRPRGEYDGERRQYRQRQEGEGQGQVQGERRQYAPRGEGEGERRQYNGPREGGYDNRGPRRPRGPDSGNHNRGQGQRQREEQPAKAE